jgi:hypothetical protein
MAKQKEMIRNSLDMQVKMRKETLMRQVREEERIDLSMLEKSRKELDEEKRERERMRRKVLMEKEFRDKTLEEAKKYRMEALLDEKKKEESMVKELKSALEAEKIQRTTKR